MNFDPFVIIWNQLSSLYIVDVNDTVVMPLQCQVVCMQMSLLTSTVATHLNDWILTEDIILICMIHADNCFSLLLKTLSTLAGQLLLVFF